MERLANKKNTYASYVEGKPKMCLDVYTNGEVGPKTSVRLCTYYMEEPSC